MLYMFIDDFEFTLLVLFQGLDWEKKHKLICQQL